MESVRKKFRTKRQQDIPKIMQELSAYLAIDFQNVVAFEKSIRGVSKTTNLHQKFQIKQVGSSLVLVHNGNLPFPSSIFERRKINRKVTHELARYGYYET
jgi:hypothetical protein